MPKAKTLAPTPQVEQPASAPSTNLDHLLKALRQPEGANLNELMTLTGWQRHSVRGALAGIVTKALGAKVISQKIDGTRRYKAPVDAA